jgi:hypothetical protein
VYCGAVAKEAAMRACINTCAPCTLYASQGGGGGCKLVAAAKKGDKPWLFLLGRENIIFHAESLGRDTERSVFARDG